MSPSTGDRKAGDEGGSGRGKKEEGLAIGSGSCFLCPLSLATVPSCPLGLSPCIYPGAGRSGAEGGLCPQ